MDYIDLPKRKTIKTMTKRYTFQEPTIEDKVWNKYRKEAWKRESDKSISNIMARYGRQTAQQAPQSTES